LAPIDAALMHPVLQICLFSRNKMHQQRDISLIKKVKEREQELNLINLFQELSSKVEQFVYDDFCDEVSIRKVIEYCLECSHNHPIFFPENSQRVPFVVVLL